MPPLADLLQQLHAIDHPYASQFDDRLFVSLLLALAAGDRNLVIRVAPQDLPALSSPDETKLSKRDKKEWVERVADEVNWICTTIFALSVHRVSCSPKTTSNAFLRSLFLPPPGLSAEPASPQKDAVPLRSLDSRRAAKRSFSLPLASLPPSVVERPASFRRQENATEPMRPAGFALDPPQFLYTGPSADDGDSSAGEDLYPTSPLSASMDRRKTASPRVPSPDQKRPSARRHTLGARDLFKNTDTGGLVGLGLDSNGERRTPPHSLSKSALRLSASRGSIIGPNSSSFFTPPRSPLQQSYLTQSERRPSIASLQSQLSNSTISPPTPTLPRLPRSPTSDAIPSTTGSPHAHFHVHIASPLASPSLSPPAAHRTNRERSPSPRKTLRPPSTYPPVSRSSTAASRSTIPLVVLEKNLPQLLILENLERVRPTVQQTLLSTLRNRTITFGPSAAHSSPRTSVMAARRPLGGGWGDDASSMMTRRTTMTAASERTRLEAEGWEGSWNLPKGFVCVAIVWDEAPQEVGWEHDGGWGEVSRHLMDRFTLSHTVPPSSLLSTFRFRAPSFPPAHPHAPPHPLLTPLPLPTSSLPSYVSDALDTYISDLISALRHHPLLEGRMLTARTRDELRHLMRIWTAISRGGGALSLVPSGAKDDSLSERKNETGKEEEEELMTLPGDVLAVLLSVLGHRVALRKPRDEKSLFWGADGRALLVRRKMERKTVEDVVRELIAVV
ncbi:hypothetical protein JCM1840_007293 [Sporobolomyces johnsonii]